MRRKPRQGAGALSPEFIGVIEWAWLSFTQAHEYLIGVLCGKRLRGAGRSLALRWNEMNDLP